MNTFKKQERLCSKRLLDLLFKNGSSFLFYPFRITCLYVNEPARFPVQVLINVSKKRYKHAFQRNLIKRRIREVYRIHKQLLLYSRLETHQLLLLSLQYVGKEIYPYSFLEQKLTIALNKLVKKFKADDNN